MINYIDNENSLVDIINFVDSFDIFINGKKEQVSKQNPKFEILISRLENLFQSSHLMPAFGVSMHDETQNELKENKWLKINFNQNLTKNGLDFSALLFKLEETSGFNLIREFNNSYDGRCLYLDLDEKTDLKEFFK